MEHNRIYFKREGKLFKESVSGFNTGIKEKLAEVGLKGLREMTGADKDSPIMVVV